MAFLVIRAVGMSHTLENLTAAGVDGAALYEDLRALHGPAVAPLARRPRPLEAGEETDLRLDEDEEEFDPEAGVDEEGGGGGVLDAVIVDRKAASREALVEWLRAWLRERGKDVAALQEHQGEEGAVSLLDIVPRRGD